jgi:hypothetical protein
MSDRNQEKLLNMKFCVKACKSNGVFLNGEMCKMTQDVGSQKKQRTDANVDIVENLVVSDRSLSVKLIAEESNRNKETVRQLITDDLGLRKCSSKMVP